ncbi:very short patch repair endonuclease [Kaistia granuli]|uniref:very short patch repair endonuclease n=1 Tax=Kaistia granuli TaxID=363259 RepID=UPI00036F7D23|nr:very short patch repair endonuclease [Kaistia granuli]
MPDVVGPITRSRMMAGIRSKNTDPEMQLRRALHARGLRFRLHSSNVPGKPDMVFPKFRAAVFVHGCFWHGHDCPLFKMPGTRQEFWSAKIERNRARDRVVQQQLKDAGWRSMTVWECAIRGPARLGIDATVDRVACWLPQHDSTTAEVRAPRKEAA